MNITEWAQRWNIPQAALDDLCASCMFTPEVDDGNADDSESVVQKEVRLEAAQRDIYLFRNNSGAGKLENGKFIRWGLANDSTKVNKVLKSADQIGIHKRLITAQDVGCYIGQFISRETKKRSWKYCGSLEENAQLKWATLINSQGGDAKIVTGTGSF